MACIYKIVNLVNNKTYIGQTVREWDVRRNEHIRGLKKGCHRNDHLQSAWDKYGSNNFEFRLIEECDVSELDEREIHYIEEGNSCDRRFGYNIESGGNQNKTLDKVTREKMSKSLRGLGGKFSENEVEKIKLRLIKGETPTAIARDLNVRRGIISDIKNCRTYEWVNTDLNEILKKISYNTLDLVDDENKKDIENRILNLESYESIGRDYGVIGETILENFKYLNELRELKKEERDSLMIDLYFKNTRNKEIHDLMGGKFESIKGYLKSYSELRKISNASKCYRMFYEGYTIKEISENLNICCNTVRKRIRMYEDYWN